MGLTDQEIGSGLDCSRSYVSRQCGRDPWSKTFQDKITAAIADGRIPQWPAK